MFSVTFFVSRLVDTYSWWNVNDSDSVQLIGYGSLIFIFNVFIECPYKEPRDQQCGHVLSFFFLFGIITISLICLSMFLYRTNKSCNSILHVVCIFNYCIVIVNISHDKIQ